MPDGGVKPGPFFGREYPGLRPGEFPLGGMTSPDPGEFEWQIGETYRGPRGLYQIMAVPKPGKILVRYLEGEWKDQEVVMDLALHGRIQKRKIALARAKEEGEADEADFLLDIWYDKYPALYKVHWQEGISSTVLLRILEEEYPLASENVREEAYG